MLKNNIYILFGGGKRKKKRVKLGRKKKKLFQVRLRGARGAYVTESLPNG